MPPPTTADGIFLGDLNKNLMVDPATETISQTFGLHPGGQADRNFSIVADIYEARGNVVRVRSHDGEPFIRRLVTAPLVAGAANTAAGPLVDLTLKPDDWETVYALDATRIYRSTDGGVTWSDIAGNLRGRPGLNLRAIEAIPTSSGALAIVIGGSQGVFYELDPGGPANLTPSWTKLGKLLPNVMVTDLS